MDKQNIKQAFWSWVDEEGGDYKVARAMGKVNGSFLSRARERDAMPKRETLQQMAEIFESFPAELMIPKFKRVNATVSDSLKEDQPTNPGLNNDGYLALQAQIEGLVNQIETLKDYNQTLKINNADQMETIKALRSKLGFPEPVSFTRKGKVVQFSPQIREEVVTA